MSSEIGAEAFNDYFVNNLPQTNSTNAEAVNHILDRYNHLFPGFEEGFAFTQITMEKVNKVLCKIKIEAKGCDNIAAILSGLL